MEYTTLIRDIRKALPGLELRENEPMGEHCSFRVGGPAAAMALPGSIRELEALAGLLRRAGVKPLVIGKGTNILPPDEGLDRFVVAVCPGVGQVQVSGGQVTADCGASLAAAASAAARAELTGLEFAHGIPGSVGGGVVMNAGAYGGELKDVAVRTDYLDEDLVPRTVQGSEHEFAYRHSVFSGREVILLRTVFSLTRGDGAQVSEKHAGFVVNAGSATAADILRLMEHIQRTVLARSGVELEPEVLILGRE